MKHLKFAFLLLFLFSITGLKAQQNHFIYIQTENKQPFYVKLDKKLYSSTGSGYLLMSKLKDGTYHLAIGFPKSAWKEQNLICTVDNNDIGYLLKNFANNRWGLLNLQTLSVVMAKDSGKVNSMDVVNKTDAFSNMLSTVVNDSTIRQTEILKEDLQLIPVKEAEKAVPVAYHEKDTAQNQVAVESSIKEATAKEDKDVYTMPVGTGIEKTEGTTVRVTAVNDSRTAITRSLFNVNADGTEMVFIDEFNGKKDTIRVFIPGENILVTLTEEKTKEIEKPKEEPAAGPVNREAKTVDSKPAETEVAGPSKKPEEKKPVENIESKYGDDKNSGKLQKQDTAGKPFEPANKKSPMINSDCKSMASDEDFLKLRKKMAAGDNDEDMIRPAKKIFKTKCFTVEQVKNLGVLFLKDSGKYAFFDMAYPFVSDSHNFIILLNQLSDAYYINRFQSMIRH